MDGSVDPTDLFGSPTRTFDPQKDNQLPPMAVELVPAEDADENKLYTYSPTTLYFKRSQILRLMMAWIHEHEGDQNNAHTFAALGDEIIPPTYYPHKTGSYWRIFKSDRDFADDCFAPWCKTENGIQKRPRSNNTPLKLETGEVFVREKRAEHHSQPGLRKQTMTISHMPEAEHVIFMMYLFCEEDMILPPVSKPKLSKEIRQIVADACDGRIFTKALDYIPKDVLGKLQMKQVRNIAKRTAGYVKSKSGPAPTTDPLELITMNSSIPGFQGEIRDVYVDQKKWKPGQPKTKKVVEIGYLNEDAWRVFLKGCANAEKLKAHRKECKAIAMLPSLQAQTSECNNTLTSLTASQLIRGVAGIIQIDTTFGLSGLFVTLIVGVLTQFVSTKSKKNRPLILGFLMHSDRKVHHHTNMGRRIDEMISHIDPNKYVSAFITDGEATLKEMCTGPAFSHAVHLRCDVHRRKNMLFKLQRLLSPEDLTLFEEMMFGTKWENNLGETVHLGGAFAMLDMERFQKELTRIKDHFEEPQITSMLVKKADDYYHCNSMMAKLRGGILCQWVTTNIIESMNFTIHRQIPRREAGHVTAGKIIHFMKNAVNELWKASIGDCSEVSIAPTAIHGGTTFVDWYKMKRPGKMEVIEYFGLPERMAGKESNLPQWVHQNYDNIEKYLERYKVEIIGDGNMYLLFKKADPLYSLTLIARNGYLICGGNNCHLVYRHTKITPCRHIIKVLSSIHSNLSRKFWDKYQLNFEQLTPRQRLALTQEGGDGTKRIGNPRTKNNDIRELNMVTHRVYNDPAVESHTVDESSHTVEESSDDDIASSSMLPNRTTRKKPTSTLSSGFDESVENEAAIRRLGLTRALDRSSAMPVKSKPTPPTRAVTSTTIKPKKPATVNSHTVDSSDDVVSSSILSNRRVQTKPTANLSPSIFDDSSENEGAIERMGLTRAIDGGSTRPVKKTTTAPTRAVTTTKPKKPATVNSHTVDSSDDVVSSSILSNRRVQTKPTANLSPSIFDDSAENEGAIERMGLTRAIDGGSTRPVKKTATAPTRAVTTAKPKKDKDSSKTKKTAAVPRGFSAVFKRMLNKNQRHQGWSEDDDDIENDHDSVPTQYSPTPYYDHASCNVTGIEESYTVEKGNLVEAPFAYGNIGGSMFPEFMDNEDFAVAEDRMQQLEIARRPHANVEKERKRSLTPLLRDEKPHYEQLEVKAAKLPRLEAPLQMNNINPNYEQLDTKPAKLLPRSVSTRPCYEERDVKPTRLSRRVIPAHDVVNFYSTNNDTDALECKSIAVDKGEQLPHKATTHRRSMRLAGSAVEEKPSGVMEKTLESDAPQMKQKKRGRPRKICLPKQ